MTGLFLRRGPNSLSACWKNAGPALEITNRSAPKERRDFAAPRTIRRFPSTHPISGKKGNLKKTWVEDHLSTFGRLLHPRHWGKTSLHCPGDHSSRILKAQLDCLFWDHLQQQFLMMGTIIYNWRLGDCSGVSEILSPALNMFSHEGAPFIWAWFNPL